MLWVIRVGLHRQALGRVSIEEEWKEKSLKCPSAFMESQERVDKAADRQTDRAQASPTASVHSPTLTDAAAHIW